MQNTNLHFEIKECPINIIIPLLGRVPEFDPKRETSYYLDAVKGKKHLALIAVNADNDVLGFKTGYERDGGFYSWLGAVFPKYRRSGIARALAEYQEMWAKRNGFSFVFFKTRNKFKGMLIFGISRGFDIVGMEERLDIAEYRILLKKTLTAS